MGWVQVVFWHRGRPVYVAGHGAMGGGQMVVSSYGAIHEITLAAGQSFTVDTGHLVAVPEPMPFKTRSISAAVADAG